MFRTVRVPVSLTLPALLQVSPPLVERWRSFPHKTHQSLSLVRSTTPRSGCVTPSTEMVTLLHVWPPSMVWRPGPGSHALRGVIARTSPASATTFQWSPPSVVRTIDPTAPLEKAPPHPWALTAHPVWASNMWRESNQLGSSLVCASTDPSLRLMAKIARTMAIASRIRGSPFLIALIGGSSFSRLVPREHSDHAAPDQLITHI